MNPSSKVPPRFVPTLTEVVPIDTTEDEAESPKNASSLDQALADVERSLGAVDAPEAMVATPAVAAAPLASFHSPWLADGLYVRGKPASIPHDLPPLPEALPPQQPFADLAVELPVEGAVANPTQSPEPLEELAEIIEPVLSAAVPALSDVAVDDSAESPEPAVLSEAAEELLVQRLMAHVEQTLQVRLQEAMNLVVQQQAEVFAQRLREEVEAAVRLSVRDAVGVVRAAPPSGQAGSDA